MTLVYFKHKKGFMRGFIQVWYGLCDNPKSKCLGIYRPWDANYEKILEECNKQFQDV